MRYSRDYEPLVIPISGGNWRRGAGSSSTTAFRLPTFCLIRRLGTSGFIPCCHNSFSIGSIFWEATPSFHGGLRRRALRPPPCCFEGIRSPDAWQCWPCRLSLSAQHLGRKCSVNCCSLFS